MPYDKVDKVKRNMKRNELKRNEVYVVQTETI